MNYDFLPFGSNVSNIPTFSSCSSISIISFTFLRKRYNVLFIFGELSVYNYCQQNQSYRSKSVI